MPSLHPQTDPCDTSLAKQANYWRYKQTISIYHFRTSHMSLNSFKSILRPDTGYTGTLYSFDPLKSTPTPHGDEIPNNSVEAAYLPAVLSRTGSALGFRVGNDAVEWLCFKGAVNETLLDKLFMDGQTVRLEDAEHELHPDDPRKVFDLVAYLEKDAGQSKRGAHTEHKRWYLSFAVAEERAVKVRLTWKNFGADLKKWREEGQGRGQANGLGVHRGEGGGRRGNIYEDDVEMETKPGRALAWKRPKSVSRAAVLEDIDTNTPSKPQMPLQVQKLRESRP